MTSTRGPLLGALILALACLSPAAMAQSDEPTEQTGGAAPAAVPPTVNWSIFRVG